MNFIVSIVFFQLSLLLLFNVTAAEKLELHSFMPPFEDVDATGSRLVSKHWRTSGTADVNKYFVRLTPDRQSKKGALWSRRQLATSNFATILQFRISGQGKNFFGDGIGFWITQQGFYQEGTLHGNVEKFTGIGIIFDTFRNTENLKSHRDVTVLVNDGTKTYEMMTENVQGCNVQVRYHAARDDFSVTHSSRVKVFINDNLELVITVDDDNSGDFFPCTKVNLEGILPADWLQDAYLGLTATTGALADNHDVISLKSYDSLKDLELNEKNANEVEYFSLNPAGPLETNLALISSVLNKLLKANEHMEHSMEHTNVATVDHIQNLLSKLERKEDESIDRIAELEEFVSKSIASHLEDRVAELETTVNKNVQKKMLNIENALDRKMVKLETTTKEFTSLSESVAGGWKLPFFLLVMLLVGAGIALYMFYEKMRKMHML